VKFNLSKPVRKDIHFEKMSKSISSLSFVNRVAAAAATTVRMQVVEMESDQSFIHHTLDSDKETTHH